MTKYLLLLVIVSASAVGSAQIFDPVKWEFETHEDHGKSVRLIFKAKIESGWHMYSQVVEEGGPVATTFHFDPSSDFILTGKVKGESKLIRGYEQAFEMTISWYEDKAVFVQDIELTGKTATVKGYLEFMVCNNDRCLQPKQVDFSFTASVNATEQLKPPTTASKAETEKIQDHSSTLDTTKEKQHDAGIEQSTHVELKDNANAATITTTPAAPISLWAIFITGLIGGFAAILMPCIFPMIPFTVSYFTKQSTTGSAFGKAFIYGLSIIAIYVCLGLLITIIFGADALNAVSTNGIFNLFFFALLVLFGASFLGAFEITLPARWATAMDNKVERGGWLGIFFMAATLALVSFSCTGLIIGTLLVQAASTGELMGPAIGMCGFALALALPFSVFAMFPAWLKALPKSGSWLNSVKVVLGFLELALALKFLSNVDLAYHWEWFDREVFLVLWIVIFGLLGMYLIGKLRFAHDSPSDHITFPKLSLAIVTFGFALYLIPGLWGAPLQAVAAFLPPQHTQDFDLFTSTLNGEHRKVSDSPTRRKYDELFHAPLNLKPFFDYEEGMAYAKKIGKPVMIDFTGHACVNCRKMEASVWPDANVYKIISDEYVLIQLYVDDKTDLPADEYYISEFSGRTIKTIGSKWSDFQAEKFNANSQPYYVLLSPDGSLLTSPRGAVYNSEEYVSYLQTGLDAMKVTRR
jgi:thiol:disulfide interchange protein